MKQPSLVNSGDISPEIALVNTDVRTEGGRGRCLLPYGKLQTGQEGN